MDFKVCCYEDGDFEAELVQLIAGDDSPGGTGLIERVVASSFAKTYPGRYQAIRPGSHGIVPGAAGLTSFTVQVMIYPTLPGGQRQVIMGQGMDFALFLDDGGALAVGVGGHEVSTGVPVRRGTG